jgi:hypothetical protein
MSLRPASPDAADGGTRAAVSTSQMETPAVVATGSRPLTVWATRVRPSGLIETPRISPVVAAMKPSPGPAGVASQARTVWSRL